MANQGPAIIGFCNGRAFSGKKRLNGNDLTLLEPTSIGAIKVADNPLWLFMQAPPNAMRSEEHTSELQSRGHLVCRLLLEKKNVHGLAQRVEHVTLDPVTDRDADRGPGVPDLGTTDQPVQGGPGDGPADVVSTDSCDLEAA